MQTFKGSPKVIWRKCLAKCSGELLGKLPPKPTEVLLLRPLSMFIQDMGLASAPSKGMTNSGCDKGSVFVRYCRINVYYVYLQGFADEWIE